MSIEACRTIARQRWGRCTAFRMGVVAGAGPYTHLTLPTPPDV